LDTVELTLTADGREGAPRDAARERFAAACLVHFEAVYRYARASVRSVHDAEDLTQDIFAQAAAALPRPREAELRAWLFAIARSRVAMFYRRRNLEGRGREIAADGRRALAAAVLEKTDLRESFSQHAAEIERAIAQLDDAERDAIHLKFSQSFSNIEIAQMLGITPGNLGVVLFRALRKIRKTLEADK
jgi:RNA polymerase sigma factor (sigma-70 family)